MVNSVIILPMIIIDAIIASRLPFCVLEDSRGEDKTVSNELSKLISLAKLTMFMTKTQHRGEYFILSSYFSSNECVKQYRFRVIFESVLASIE